MGLRQTVGIEFVIDGGTGFGPELALRPATVQLGPYTPFKWQARLRATRRPDLFDDDPVSRFRDSKLIEELTEWLKEHDPRHNRWTSIDGYAAIEFSSENAAMAFKMRWL